MIEIKAEDLRDAFLLIVRIEKNQRDRLPFVRRHLRSVINVCRSYADARIDVYFSGILIGQKKRNDSRITMTQAYRKIYPGDNYAINT